LKSIRLKRKAASALRYSRDKAPDCCRSHFALHRTPEASPGLRSAAGQSSDKTTLATSCARSKPNTARPNGSGSWTGHPHEDLRKCGPAPAVYYLVALPARLKKYEADSSVSLGKRCAKGKWKSNSMPRKASFSFLPRAATGWPRNAPCACANCAPAAPAQRTPRHEAFGKVCCSNSARSAGRYRAACGSSTSNCLRCGEKPPPPSLPAQPGKKFATSRREGRYLLRTNLCDKNPAKFEPLHPAHRDEAAFKTLKGRPEPASIQPARRSYRGHILSSRVIASTSPSAPPAPHAPGHPEGRFSTSRRHQMVDVHFPTTDGRTLILSATPSPRPIRTPAP